MARLRGTIAAASTPLTESGAALDEGAFGPYADFLVGAGLDGLLAFGTNGEAVLMTVDERRRGLELWLEAESGLIESAQSLGAPPGHVLSTHPARTMLTIVAGVLSEERPNPVNARWLGA